ncbi:hypothetical protein [Photobacterium sanguinicancri]|uniref:Uncharacterized protein n=1 Tax=Photobacterium sanguinicancri TaxID=875932 RepID=A0ABX4FT13_9GAMM|nr:hypothetical protein [Photobacterium sanguinicancri]OZS42028.1 hypothetical protein ASV53_20610 [Photobacterium sanguinicancri]
MVLKYKVIILLLVSTNIYIIHDWISFYKINKGRYITTIKDINVNSYSLAEVKLEIKDHTIQIQVSNVSPNDACIGSYVSATYDYYQHFLNKTIKLTQGHVTVNHPQKACKVRAYNEFARVLGYGTSHQLNVLNDTNGDICFRSNQLGTYCFGASDE